MWVEDAAIVANSRSEMEALLAHLEKGGWKVLKRTRSSRAYGVVVRRDTTTGSADIHRGVEQWVRPSAKPPGA